MKANWEIEYYLEDTYKGITYDPDLDYMNLIQLLSIRKRDNSVGNTLGVKWDNVTIWEIEGNKKTLIKEGMDI